MEGSCHTYLFALNEDAASHTLSSQFEWLLRICIGYLHDCHCEDALRCVWKFEDVKYAGI